MLPGFTAEQALGTMRGHYRVNQTAANASMPDTLTPANCATDCRMSCYFWFGHRFCDTWCTYHCGTTEM
jgi:hypothetical protein